LLYRLQVVTIVLPPLRERMEEVRPLAERFVAQAAAEHGRALEAVAPDYFEALEKHPWPGNIRELRHAVESSVILARGATLTRQDLAFERPPADRAAESLRIPAGATLADIEKEALAQALQRHRGNRNAVAQELGVSARTVLRKIKEYALPY
jgi:DNA-binding NtrC family response regulator